MGAREGCELSRQAQTYIPRQPAGRHYPTTAKYIKGPKEVDGYTMAPRYYPQVQWAILPQPTTTACIWPHVATLRNLALPTDQMYDNFKIMVEANYIALGINQPKDVWSG